MKSPTTLPWRVDNYGDVAGSSIDPIFSVTHRLADAQFAVHAANNHDPLVEALEQMILAYDGVDPDGMIRATAEEVLKEAKGE